MTETKTTPDGYSRANLRWALRELASWSASANMSLTLSVDGWGKRTMRGMPKTELAVLGYEGLLYAAPDEHPEDYTDATIEGLAEWIDRNIGEWVRAAIEDELDAVEREESHRSQREQRDANPDATSERLETLRAILCNLRTA